jgi:hypothetical protein
MPAGPRPPFPENTGRVAISGTFQDAAWVNIFYVLLTSADDITTSDVNDLAAMFDDPVSALYDTLSEALHVSQIRLVFHRSDDTFLVGEHPMDITGSDSAVATSANDAAVVSWPLGVSYRGGKPRTYFCGLTDADEATTQHLADGFRVALAANAADFRNAVNGFGGSGFTTCELGTVSYSVDDTWRDPPIFRTYVGDPVVHPRISSQRRRLGAWSA